jgi:hypothetical protein
MNGKRSRDDVETRDRISSKWHICPEGTLIKKTKFIHLRREPFSPISHAANGTREGKKGKKKTFKNEFMTNLGFLGPFGWETFF